MARKKPNAALIPTNSDYDGLLTTVSSLLEQGRRATVRAANAILTATYWDVGRHIVEFQQGGKVKAEYSDETVTRLAIDLTNRFGRGFSRRNLFQMKAFYVGWEIVQTVPAQLHARVRRESENQKVQTLSAQLQGLAGSHVPTDSFPLPWSHYVRLMAVKDDAARAFYEEESIRGAWSVRQLDRQIATQFFERTAKSRTKEAMLIKGRQPHPEDIVTIAETIRDPYLLEFLDLKDEYSEADLEAAIIHHLEAFLLELGSGFTFVARQKRIRIGHEWYHIDLLLYHRRLRCLVVIDLKLGKFTHADAGQMNLYLNFAREHLMEPDENEPVGLILCSDKDDAVVHYAMGGIAAKVFASRYLTVLPDEATLRQEILTTQRALADRERHGK